MQKRSHRQRYRGQNEPQVHGRCLRRLPEFCVCPAASCRIISCHQLRGEGCQRLCQYSRLRQSRPSPVYAEQGSLGRPQRIQPTAHRALAQHFCCGQGQSGSDGCVLHRDNINLVADLYKIGWVINGNMPGPRSAAPVITAVTLLDKEEEEDKDEELKADLIRLWQLEEVGHNSSKHPDPAEAHYLQTSSRQESGR